MVKDSIFRKNFVPKLWQLATEEFADTLGSALKTIAEDIDNEAEEAEALEKINKYLIEAGTTTPVYHKLLKLILSCASPAYALAVELLFNQTFKHFRAINCGDKNSRMAMAIATKATALSALESLDLSDCCLDESDWYIFELILKNYPNLKDIELPRKPDFGYWLPLLSDNCTKLRHLTAPSLYNLCGIANASFRTTLQIINIQDCDDVLEDYLRELTPLFNTCPNLCFVVPDHDAYLSRVIQNCIATNPNFSCNLKCLGIKKPKEALLQQITKACPKLIDLTLRAPTDCTLAVLSPLQLQSLDISVFDVPKLLQLPENWRNHLKRLSLRSEYRGASIDVYEVLNKYQNLTKLQIELSSAHCNKKIEYPHALAKFYMLRCNFPKQELLNFLSGLINLQEFFADEVFFTDEDMDKVFGGNSFLHFKTFFVEKALNLTIRSVHILLESCPKLEYVGPLLGWNIQKSELKSIPSLILMDHKIYVQFWYQLYF